MPNVPATQTGGAVANPDDYNPYAAYGEQATGGARNIIKFRKGRFFYGQDDIEIPLGTRMIANMAEAKVGWVRWWDGRPTDEVMVLIGDGVAPPRRGELGDDDRARWETGDRRDPRDPWQFTNHLPLKGPETGDGFLFATNTRGGYRGHRSVRQDLRHGLPAEARQAARDRVAGVRLRPSQQGLWPRRRAGLRTGRLGGRGGPAERGGR